MYLLFIKLFFEYIPKLIFIELAARPGIARGKKNSKKKCGENKIPIFLAYYMSVQKSFSSFYPAVWPARQHIYIRMSCFII